MAHLTECHCVRASARNTLAAPHGAKGSFGGSFGAHGQAECELYACR